MKRTVHNFVQGSPEWHSYRSTPKQFNASDAPAMLGESPYKTRDELLREYATGIRPEIDERKQKLFDDGHRYEQEDRPIAEDIIGQELFPATVSLEFDGLRLSASLDGWTMDEEIIYEHKTLNNSIRDAGKNEVIPLVYAIQLEQQLLCSGAKEALFRGSLGSNTDEAVTIWYKSNQELCERVINGWKQFSIDLDNYNSAPINAVTVVGKDLEELPALLIEIEGSVKNSNLTIYKNRALDFVRNVKKDLQTDQDFADAEKVVKFCDKVEKELALAKKQILSQAVSINDALSIIDVVSTELKETRLMLDKLIKAEKNNRKQEIFIKASNEWNSFIGLCNKELSLKANISMPIINVDIAGSYKGMSKLDNIQSAANDCIANAKINATIIKNKIIESIDFISEKSGEYQFLFNDIPYLVSLDLQTLGTVMQSRINDHKAAEEKRIAEAAEKRAQEIAAQERTQLAQQQPVVNSTQRQQEDAQAAIAFNQQQASRLMKGGYSSAPIAQNEPIKVSEINQSGIAFDVLSEAIRDLENICGLTPAIAQMVAKSIYDGQHRHISFNSL